MESQNWRQEYNEKRPHSSLDYETPEAFELDALSITYIYSEIYIAEWNDTSELFKSVEYYPFAGFAFNFSNLNSLPADDYTYHIPISGQPKLTETVYYPGLTEAPIVEHLGYTWEMDGSLTLF